MIKKLQKGFTLIELLVVISIIVILATMAISSYLEATKGARDGKRRSDIETIKQAMILYRQDMGTYAVGGSTSDLSGVQDELIAENFLSNPAPRDPLSTQNYTITGSTGTAFCLCADLEGTRGNASNASCANIGATSGGFYCARQL
jgi:prepilin-type N-terminal cleavage/methylation domain-containing protein